LPLSSKVGSFAIATSLPTNQIIVAGYSLYVSSSNGNHWTEADLIGPVDSVNSAVNFGFSLCASDSFGENLLGYCLNTINLYSSNSTTYVPYDPSATVAPSPRPTRTPTTSVVNANPSVQPTTGAPATPLSVQPTLLPTSASASASRIHAPINGAVVGGAIAGALVGVALLVGAAYYVMVVVPVSVGPATSDQCIAVALNSASSVMDEL
jgi:hypothetical protein